METCQNSQCPRKDLNQILPECKSDTFPLKPTFQKIYNSYDLQNWPGPCSAIAVTHAFAATFTQFFCYYFLLILGNITIYCSDLIERGTLFCSEQNLLFQ
jgi:hypothetical protein